MKPSRGCPTCHGHKYLLERLGEKASARVCACTQPCATCGGAGYVLGQQEATFSKKVGPKKYDVLAPCSCRLLEKRVGWFNREANVPGILASADFDGFKPESGQERAMTVAMRFAHGYSRQKQQQKQQKGFVLSGPVGTGKTHLLAAAIGHLVLEIGARAKYVEISLIYADIRRGFDAGKSSGEIIGPLSEVEVLAIDELGKGRGSQFEMETLDELIARRYNAGRTTLFATNYSLADEPNPAALTRGGYINRQKEAEREGKTPEERIELLRGRVGERIYSRLCEMCDFVQMPGDTRDMRRASQEDRGGRAGLVAGAAPSRTRPALPPRRGP